jgi:acetylornithine deacetylase/succinyl-diaminopimelate desuccinylase-like protein
VLLQKPACFDIHGPDERTTIADLEDIYAVYKEFVLSV